MVDIALIKETITELLNANVDKETIIATLKDIGVDEGDIVKYYSEITENQKSGKETKKKEKIEEEETTTEESEEENNDPIPEEPKIMSKAKIPEPTTTTEELEKVTQEIIDSEPEIIFEKVEEKPTIDNFETIELKKQITEIDERTIEIKAQMNALTKIMKDILEENRNILNKLK